MVFSPSKVPSPEDFSRIQGQKLRLLLRYLNTHSPFYREFFSKHRIDIRTIKQVGDLSAIPFTTKDDLQQRNDDFLCVNRENVAEYMATSGTLGKPVTIALTRKDLERLATNEYQSFLCSGGKAGEIYQLMVTLDKQFMAGMAYYSGLRKLGAGIIRIGLGAPTLHLEAILRLKPTCLVSVPSFLLKMTLFAKEQGINLNTTSVRKGICIGENIRNPDFSLNTLGKRIRESWNINLLSTYASTEMQTAFTECPQMRGGHLQPELLILEVLDDNGQPVSPYVPGEVVITTLGVEGMPLLRYRTGDICMFYDEPCPCGRSSLRLSPVIGRKQQMIKFKGTTFYPPALFDLLDQIREVADYAVEIYTNEVGLDEVLLNLVLVNQAVDSDQAIKKFLHDKLKVTPHIKLVSPPEMQKIQFPANTRKAIRWIDRRV